MTLLEKGNRGVLEFYGNTADHYNQFSPDKHKHQALTVPTNDSSDSQLVLLRTSTLHYTPAFHFTSHSV